MVLRAGRVKIATVEADGREVMLSIRDPGDIVGEPAFIAATRGSRRSRRSSRSRRW